MSNPAIIGNQFWKLRKTHGRHLKFDTPEVLLKLCEEYFEWVENNPLWDARPFPFQGEVTIARVPKMRAMTVTGLCLFLDINIHTWHAYREREGYKDVVARVEGVIREQKFTGAAAELLNPAIIARDLGLSDKQQNEHAPVQVNIVRYGEDEDGKNTA